MKGRTTASTAGAAEQHDDRSTIGNRTTGRSEELDERDVLYRIIERDYSRADKRFVSRGTIESVELIGRATNAVLDEHAIQRKATSSQVP